MTFSSKLADVQRNKQSVLCVGLDPDVTRIPASFYPNRSHTERILAFNKEIIEATQKHASAYKINFAFYERYGRAGWSVLEQTLELIPEDVLRIADNKRGDIGNSATFYAASVFEAMGFDACTVAPYMGADSIAPFLTYPGKAAFVLARTSNPGGADIQEQLVDGEPLYKILVRQLNEKAGTHTGCTGLVVGATTGTAMAEIRQLAPRDAFFDSGCGCSRWRCSFSDGINIYGARQYSSQ